MTLSRHQLVTSSFLHWLRDGKPVDCDIDRHRARRVKMIDAADSTVKTAPTEAPRPAVRNAPTGTLDLHKAFDALDLYKSGARATAGVNRQSPQEELDLKNKVLAVLPVFGGVPASHPGAGADHSNGAKGIVSPEAVALSEYSGWLKRVTPTIGAQDGSLPWDALYSNTKLQGRDEALGAVLDNHEIELFGAFNKITPAEIENLPKVVSDGTAKRMQREIEVGTQFAKVVDWLKSNRDKFDGGADGCVSRSSLDRAARDPNKFQDPESRRMLQFLQHQYDFMAEERGIPDSGSSFEELLVSGLTEKSAGRWEEKKFELIGGEVGTLVGAGAGAFLKRPLAGAAVGLFVGTLAGDLSHWINSNVRQLDPYQSFLGDLKKVSTDYSQGLIKQNGF
jgi:hypothetical protein